MSRPKILTKLLYEFGEYSFGVLSVVFVCVIGVGVCVDVAVNVGDHRETVS